jgi:hypothetical protein
MSFADFCTDKGISSPECFAHTCLRSPVCDAALTYAAFNSQCQCNSGCERRTERSRVWHFREIYAASGSLNTTLSTGVVENKLNLWGTRAGAVKAVGIGLGTNAASRMETCFD